MGTPDQAQRARDLVEIISDLATALLKPKAVLTLSRLPSLLKFIACSEQLFCNFQDHGYHDETSQACGVQHRQERRIRAGRFLIVANSDARLATEVRSVLAMVEGKG